MPKRHILGWQILLPYNGLGQAEEVNKDTQGGSYLASQDSP